MPFMEMKKGVLCREYEKNWQCINRKRKAFLCPVSKKQGLPLSHQKNFGSCVFGESKCFIDFCFTIK